MLAIVISILSSVNGSCMAVIISSKNPTCNCNKFSCIKRNLPKMRGEKNSVTCTHVLGTLATYAQKTHRGGCSHCHNYLFSFYNQPASFLVRLSCSCITFIYSLFPFQVLPGYLTDMLNLKGTRCHLHKCPLDINLPCYVPTVLRRRKSRMWPRLVEENSRCIF